MNKSARGRLPVSHVPVPTVHLPSSKCLPLKLRGMERERKGESMRTSGKCGAIESTEF